MVTGRSIVRLLGGCVLLMCSTYAIAEIKAGKYPRVYQGNEGVQVTVVEIQDSEPKQALVMVTGVQTRIDDVILLHTEIPDNKGFALETYVNDDKFWTLNSQQERWGGKNLRLTLPEAVMEKIYLGYNEKLSKKVKPEEFVKRYEKQLADGAVQKVQRYNGKDLMPRTNGVFKRAVNDAKSACSAPIGAKINWDSIKEGAKGTLPIATLCRQPSEFLIRYCDEHKDHKVAEKIKLIQCSFGNEQKLSLGSGKQLNWQVPVGKKLNQKELQSQLEKILKS